MARAEIVLDNGGVVPSDDYDFAIRQVLLAEERGSSFVHDGRGTGALNIAHIVAVVRLDDSEQDAE